MPIQQKKSSLSPCLQWVYGGGRRLILEQIWSHCGWFGVSKGFREGPASLWSGQFSQRADCHPTSIAPAKSAHLVSVLASLGPNLSARHITPATSASGSPKQSKQPGSKRPGPTTSCATVPRPTCTKMEPTPESSSNSSATPDSIPPASTRKSPSRT